MSRLDRIEELLTSPTQCSTEGGMPVHDEDECWRCGVRIDPKVATLGACDLCVTYLRSEQADAEVGDVDPIGPDVAVMEAVLRLSPAMRAGVQRMADQLNLIGQAFARYMASPAGERLRGAIDEVVGDEVGPVSIGYDLSPVVTFGGMPTCAMNDVDVCDGLLPCAVCPRRPDVEFAEVIEEARRVRSEVRPARMTAFVANPEGGWTEIGEVTSVDAAVTHLTGEPPIERLARPIENCPHIDPEDGTCGHPDAITPECWDVGDGMTSDCPPLGGGS